MAKGSDLSEHRARGRYGPSYASTAIFVCLRWVNMPLQYWILTRSAPFGIADPPSGGNMIRLWGGMTVTPFQAANLSCCFVTAIKHTIWMTCIRREVMTIGLSIFGGIGDAVFDAFDSFAFLLAAANPAFSPLQLWIGTALHNVAVLAELVAELQWKRFKERRENKGRLYSEGFFGWTRHFNLTCNFVFGFAHGMAAAGVPWGIVMSSLYLMNFVWNAIPPMEDYLKEKYGKEWEAMARKVPYRLIPFVY